MLGKLLLSIASKPKSLDLNALLKQLYEMESLDMNDKVSLKYTLTVAEQGNYPGQDYYIERGYESHKITNSLSELKQICIDLIDFYTKESIIKNALTSINTAENAQDLASKLSSFSKSVQLPSASLKDSRVQFTLKGAVVLKEDQFLIGVSEVDGLTKGIQPGTVASICAFTGHGKSTLAVSCAYKNLKAGKKGAIFSLEMTPKIVITQIFIRYLFDVHGLIIPFLTFMSESFTDEEKVKVEAALPEFNKWIFDKIVVLDESYLNKRNITSFEEMNALYAAIDKELGCLDFILFDHIGQVELMFKEMGNTAVRTFTSASKTFVNSQGSNPCTIFCVQTNREGFKRASKRQGRYDLMAISELNEVERSSTYVIFLFTNDSMKLTQETKVCMLKHRLGSELSEPVTVNFNPAVYIVGEEVEQVSFGGDFTFGLDTGTGAGDINLDDLTL